MTLQNVKDRIQFVGVLTLFFPTLLNALTTDSNQIKSNSNILLWGFVVAMLIINYLIIEVRGDSFKAWLVKWVNILLLINVAAFIPVLFVLAAAQTHSISFLYLSPFMAGVIGTMIVPLLILILLVIDIVIARGRELRELVCLMSRRKN